MKTPAFTAILALMLLAGCAQQSVEVTAARQRSPYTKPLSTPGARFGSLPMVVQNTVRSEAGMAEIIDVVKDTSSGHPVYKIYFRNPNIYPPLFIGADGSVLNYDLTVAVQAPKELNPEVKLSDLPLAVTRTFEERPGKPEVASIMKESWGDHTVFVFTFKDDVRNPKLYIAADGNTLIQATK